MITAEPSVRLPRWFLVLSISTALVGMGLWMTHLPTLP